MKRNRPASMPRNNKRFIKVFCMLVIMLTTAGLSVNAGIKNFPPGIPYATVVNVTGHVTDANGAAVAGASVRVKGSNAGTATDASGNYTLNNVADNAVLIFSSVGYETVEVAVNGRAMVNVIMKISAVTGEQVVVVGYGTQRKRDVTGSIASVKGSELSKQPVLTATQALQGKVAGVQIISSGSPNSAPTVRIRGTGSILLGADPLYVVDGVLTDDIRNINTADITSEEVLKDASSASIYGVRAANGVILITTKKGRVGKMQISYDANAGIRQVANLVKMANSQQYATYINEASVNTGNGAVLVDPALTGTSTDWYKTILRTSFEQNHNLSISGGTDKITYFLSGGYITDEGIVLNNTFQRFTLRSNNEYRISSKLKLNTLLSFSNGNTQDVNLGAAYNDAYHAAPIIPSKVNGRYGNTSSYQNVGNPVLDIENADNRYRENRLQANAYLEYKPVSWLTLKSSYGTELAFNNRRIYTNAFQNDSSTFITAGGNQTNPKSSLSITDDHNDRWVWDNTATFQKTIGKNDITVLAGTTSENIFTRGSTESRSDVPPDRSLWYLSQGDPATQTNNSYGDKRLRVSYLGRVNYAYDHKYLLTASLRDDGSSVFSTKYATFPSFGLGWIITDEKFMENQKIFNSLKLRGSYGKLGNDNISTSAIYETLSTGLPYVFNGQVVNTGAVTNGFVDKNLQWEVTTETDLGLEFGLLHRRLTGEFDAYDKKVKNALIDVNVSTTTGQQDVLTNVASIENKGLELSLSWNDKVGKNIRYNVSANASYLNNKVIGLNGGQPIFGGSVGSKGNTTYTTNGQPIGAFYLLQAEGVIHNQTELAAYTNSQGTPITIDGQIPALGDLKYKDVNDDGKIDANDRVFEGSYQPKYTFGVNLGVSYKGIDLSVDGYGTAGAKIYNGKKEARFNQKDNVESSVADDRWTFTNYASNVPRASLNALPHSTYFLESGDFFRINNLTLGYTLKSPWVAKYISSLRVYATAQNLVTFTGYTGFSPEIQNGDALGQGIEFNAYPTTRTYAFGVNVNF
jgi:TonB-linked SusC/RagA family outer membrane protein